ncbi:MAG: hypothetical protein K8S87_04070, partial [Planctomycetes bacterium]|nr:hypothetical protein [Planctomycetota bacterium]
SVVDVVDILGKISWFFLAFWILIFKKYIWGTWAKFTLLIPPSITEAVEIESKKYNFIRSKLKEMIKYPPYLVKIRDGLNREGANGSEIIRRNSRENELNKINYLHTILESNINNKIKTLPDNQKELILLNQRILSEKLLLEQQRKGIKYLEGIIKSVINSDNPINFLREKLKGYIGANPVTRNTVNIIIQKLSCIQETKQDLEKEIYRHLATVEVDKAISEIKDTLEVLLNEVELTVEQYQSRNLDDVETFIRNYVNSCKNDYIAKIIEDNIILYFQDELPDQENEPDDTDLKSWKKLLPPDKENRRVMLINLQEDTRPLVQTAQSVLSKILGQHRRDKIIESENSYKYKSLVKKAGMGRFWITLKLSIIEILDVKLIVSAIHNNRLNLGKPNYKESKILKKHLNQRKTRDRISDKKL